MNLRVSLLSDLHVEYDRDEGRELLATLDPDRCDLLVLAGDVSSLDFVELLCERYAPRPVVYVAGNHEYWRGTHGEFAQAAYELSARTENLKVLDRGFFTYKGQRFLGATCWYSDPGQRNWADFRFIRDLPQWLDADYALTRSFMEDNMHEGDIIISHMVPSVECVAPRWQGNPNNKFFVNDFSTLIKERKPRAWLFGHTHDKIAQRVGETMMYTNPRGYAVEKDITKFDPYFTLEFA